MEELPDHVAIVPDGNRRWAKDNGVSRLEGHQAGASAMQATVEAMVNYGIKYLTLWGFSTDNWKRTENEIFDIFTLLEWWIMRDLSWMNSHGVRLRHIGRLKELPRSLQDVIKMAIAQTADNTGLTLNLAFNYSGRTEIVDAVNQLLSIGVRVVDESSLRHFLYSDSMPDVDLVIRTAGDSRISNFMVWQTAYSEFFFTEVLWPDFGADDIKKALEAYAESQRRFGGD